MSSSSEDLLGYTPPIGEVLRTAINAQIRAFTGGDITKEEAVLSMDTWRALTELDAILHSPICLCVGFCTHKATIYCEGWHHATF